MAAGGGSLGKMLGLGFLFGAKDTGVAKTTKKVSEGFNQVTESVDRVGSGTKSLVRFGNVISTLSVLQLDRISDTLDGIADRAGVGVAGAGNQIESFGAQFGLTFKQATAGMGPFSKEMDKLKGQISGTAFTLQIGGEELTKSIANITKTGSTLKDFGLTVRDVGGSIQAQVLDGEQLAEVLTELSHGYGLGDKGAKALLDRQTALGEAFGVGADAARAMPEIMKAADPILARFTNLNVDEVTDSLTRLAIAAQKEVGGTFQQRMEDAVGVFARLGEERKTMADLVTGLSSDFPNLAKEIAIATGDVGASLEDVMSDPLKFAKSMQMLTARLGENNPRLVRLRSALGEMPDGFNFLIQGGADAAAKLEEASKPIENFGGAFNKMVRGASGDSRTFAERMEVMKDSFENSLRSLTKTTDKEVLGRQRRAYKNLRKVMDETIKQGGAKGALTQAFLDVRRYGLIHGLIPSIELAAKKMGWLNDKSKESKERFSAWTAGLADAADMLSTFAVQAGPMLIVLSQLGVFKPISKGMELMWKGAKKVVLFLFKPFARFGKNVKAFGIADAFRIVGHNVAKMLGPFKKAGGVIGRFLPMLGRFGFLIARVLTGPLGWLATIGLTIWRNWDVLKPAFEEIWAVLEKDLTPAFQELSAIGEHIAIGWEVMKDFAKDLGKAVWKWIKGVATEAWKSFRDGVKIVWRDYLVPFGKWFKKNLPAMIAAGTVAILKAIAHLRFGFKALGVKAAASLDLISAGWEYISVILETRVLNAFDKMANVFGGMIEGWELGFARVQAFFTGLPVTIMKMVKSVPSAILERFGISSKDIDKNLSAWTKKQTEANDRVKDLERERSLRLQEDDARRQARQAKLATAERGLRAAELRHTTAMMDLEQKRDKELRRAESRMDPLTARIGAAFDARRAAREAPADEPAAATSRRRGGGARRTRVAARQEAALAAAAPRYVTAGGTDLTEFFKKEPIKTEYTEKGKQQAIEIAVAAGKKSRGGPRASANGGGASPD